MTPPSYQEQEIVRNVKRGLMEMIQGAAGENMVREIIRRALDPMVGETALRERIDRLILTGWHNEKRRLFLAGAEWARRFGDSEGFYTAAEDAAREAVTKVGP